MASLRTTLFGAPGAIDHGPGLFNFGARDESPADRQARQVFEGMSVMRTREVISVRLTIPDSQLIRH